MWIKVLNDGLSNDYESKSRWIGALFIFIGIITSIYALFSVLSPSLILGVILTATGLVSTYLTAKINPNIPASWTKSLLIFLSGLILLFANISTPSLIALLIGIFFLLGTLNDLYFAYITRKDATAYAWSITALLNLLFAYQILSNMETIPADAIGVLISISLIANGIALIFSGRTIYIRP